MTEWQPIETAPNDVWVLLYDNTFGDWPAHFIARRKGGTDIWRGEGKDGPCAEDPTHWMPLPAPPQQESE